MSEEIRVRFFTDYSGSDYPSNAMLETYGTRHTKRIVLVDDESYTHAVIINAPRPALKAGVPKENVIGLAWEPLELLAPPEGAFKEELKRAVRRTFLDLGFISWGYRHMSRYYVGKLGHLPGDLFAEGHGYIHCNHWMRLYQAQPRPVKKRPMSLVLSQKGFLPGHVYRHMLAQLILRTDLPIDIYGYGSDRYQPDPRAKGAFQLDEPYRDYMFTLAIENTIADHYITEKFTNPLASDCIPVYLGGRAEDYYGPSSHYKLVGDVVADFNTILDLVANAEQRYQACDLAQAQREMVDGRANFYRFLEREFLGGSKKDLGSPC